MPDTALDAGASKRPRGAQTEHIRSSPLPGAQRGGAQPWRASPRNGVRTES